VVVEPTGSEILVVARLGGQEITLLFRERLAVLPGETLHITPFAGLTHLFDEATGARLVQ